MKSLVWLNDAFAELDKSDLIRRERVVAWRDGMRAIVDGRDAVVFCSNDYLGMARGAPATDENSDEGCDAGIGAGSTGSRLITGTSAAHVALEREVAEWKGSAAAVLFGSGTLANIGAIPALVGRGDAIYADELNHASLIDGCRLSRAEVHTVRHRDSAALANALTKGGAFRRKLVVTESVFSMEGDVAPLEEWVDIAERFGAMTYVDEAHAAGIVGPDGAGLVRARGLESRVSATMTPAGKALGCEGAFVTGTAQLCSWLVNKARTYVFTTAPSPMRVRALWTAVRAVRRAEAARAALKENARRFSSLLNSRDSVGGNEWSAIFPRIVGDSATALGVAAKLLDRGFFVQAIRPPTVPDGTARLRITMSALHREEDIVRLAREIKDVVPPSL
ncbi:MAG: 8-amino-7-oxononanoate synthase [Deltaproteobacteria bacterium]|nr:8-amino-7-oxononanoate synthase [Deltaproteobacteria bacterium]